MIFNICSHTDLDQNQAGGFRFMQAGGGQEETRRRFAHERQIRPAKLCPHYCFGKNTMHHHQNIATY